MIVLQLRNITNSNGRRSRTWRNSHPGIRHDQSTYEVLSKECPAVSELFQNHRISLHALGAIHSAFARSEHGSHVLHQAMFCYATAISQVQATHMLRRTVNVDVKMLVRFSRTQSFLKPSMFFWRTRQMYSSSVRLQELSQSLTIVLIDGRYAFAGGCWRRSHG